MKIAYIGQKGIPMIQGGVEAHVENLAIEMTKKGHEVFVYTRNYYTDKNLKEYQGIKLIHLPTIKTKNLDAISHTFFASIHALFQDYDIIHYHAVGPALLSFIPRLFSKAKIIGTFHCKDRFHKKWGLFARLMLFLGEYAISNFPNKTILVSEELQKNYQKKKINKFFYIPNGFKIEKDFEIDYLKAINLESQKYFLLVSRLIAHKGIQYAIQAFNKLEDEKYKLVIVGDTFYNKQYVKFLEKEAQNNKNIIFTGQKNGKNLNQLFTNAFSFVIPSEGEGLSITLLEAMAHGLPVIASDIEGNQVFIKNNLIYNFENKNSLDLLEKIKYLINNKGEALSKAQETQKHIQENFSWLKIGNEIEKIYRD